MVTIAGNYPNVPSWRMAWDRDGTVAMVGLTQLTSGQMIALNNESDDSTQATTLCLIFPELRDIDAFLIMGASTYQSQPGTWKVQTSVNSTNGIDGVWVDLVASMVGQGFTTTGARTGITSATVLAVKAIRFVLIYVEGNMFVQAIHLFGEISPGQNPNRLVLWHPTLDQRITPAWFDWGNAPRSSSADKTFRVKNNSSLQTATAVRVAQEIFTDTTPSVVGQHTLSTDATSFLAQVNVGDLAPGAISGVVTLRRVTPANATLSLWCHRVFAEATTWTS